MVPFKSNKKQFTVFFETQVFTAFKHYKAKNLYKEKCMQKKYTAAYV